MLLFTLFCLLPVAFGAPYDCDAPDGFVVICHKEGNALHYQRLEINENGAVAHYENHEDDLPGELFRDCACNEEWCCDPLTSGLTNCLFGTACCSDGIWGCVRIDRSSMCAAAGTVCGETVTVPGNGNGNGNGNDNGNGNGNDNGNGNGNGNGDNPPGQAAKSTEPPSGDGEGFALLTDNCRLSDDGKVVDYPNENSDLPGSCIVEFAVSPLDIDSRDRNLHISLEWEMARKSIYVVADDVLVPNAEKWFSIGLLLNYCDEVFQWAFKYDTDWSLEMGAGVVNPDLPTTVDIDYDYETKSLSFYIQDQLVHVMEGEKLEGVESLHLFASVFTDAGSWTIEDVSEDIPSQQPIPPEQSTSDTSSEFTAMTYNVLLTSGTDGGNRAWKKMRRWNILEAAKQNNADIIGFQEVSTGRQYADLEEIFTDSGYEVIGFDDRENEIYSEHDIPTSFNKHPIAVNQEKFEVLESGTFAAFWSDVLSEEDIEEWKDLVEHFNEESDAVMYLADPYRVANWVLVKDLDNKRLLLTNVQYNTWLGPGLFTGDEWDRMVDIVTTGFIHTSNIIVDTIADIEAQYGFDGAIILGDFEVMDNPAVQPFLDDGFVETYWEMCPTGGSRPGQGIDRIYAKNLGISGSHYDQHIAYTGLPIASNHAPLVAVLQFD